MDTTHRRRDFLALVTGNVSRLVSASDVDTVAEQLVSLPTPGMLVSCCFESSSDALCWLTHPVPVEAVQSVVGSGLLGPPSPGASAGCWFAVASSGSRSCFNFFSSGTGGALSLMKESMSPLCAVGRFAVAADAYRWLATSATQELLQVLSDV